MWLLVTVLYRVVSFPLWLVAQAAMALGAVTVLFAAISLFFFPLARAATIGGIGAATMLAGIALYVLVETIARRIDDRRDERLPGITGY
ncbi:hypothetical protein QLH51_06575 [Sphingomonas sp. 2R-10]|uniref:hypothetical protein n=1 Tax=Sphingomonas sp. 2R-10 TaxID=3045148 RepID=UPI000F7994FF|nr:hypothetical protein [Sphingomonas sp. 2R-10]MDJ0276457.1 hypothetical protein [Sphingomonas sp. 2R-10]